MGTAILNKCNELFATNGGCSLSEDMANDMRNMKVHCFSTGCVRRGPGVSVCADDSNGNDWTAVCPGTTPLPPDMSVGTMCATNGQHTLDHDEDRKCIAPSDLTADFLAGKSWSTYACLTGAAGSGCTGMKYWKATGSYQARNVGATLTSDLSWTGPCSELLFNPWNSGTLSVIGAASSHAVIYNPVNVAPSPASLTFSSAKITLLGAQNEGTGPLTVSTS